MNSMSSEKARSNRTEALVILAISTGVGLLLSGCGSPAKVSSTPVVPAAQGVVHGGQQPVAGVSLQLYTTGNSNYGTSASGFVPADNTSSPVTPEKTSSAVGLRSIF